MILCLCHRARRLLVMIACLLALHPSSTDSRAFKAPQISKPQDPVAEVPFKLGEDVTLMCQADSDAKYAWTKNGQHLDLSGRHVALVQQSGSGELIIRAPSDKDNGIYQCLASNKFGTAASPAVKVQKAMVEPLIKLPIVGQSLTLPCSLRPLCYPEGDSYWGISRPTINKLTTLINDARVLLDYSGNLRIANVLMDDSHEDFNLVCIMHNQKLGAFVQGSDHKIRPREESGGAQSYAPHLMWSSPTADVAVKGNNKTMKCIFGGLPTPRVTWRRAGGRPLSGRVRFPDDGYGTEIKILGVLEEDAGWYECGASSDSGEAKLDIHLSVESMPLWNQDRPPADVQVEEDGTAEFDCQAHGSPKPNVTWSFNGIPHHDMKRNARILVNGTKVRFLSVTQNDTQVLQCLAQNEHGSKIANAHLTVIAAPPSFTAAPHDAKIVEGASVTFNCHAYGAPKPVITWHRGESASPVYGDRFTVHPNGDLEITHSVLSDASTYTCQAENKFDVARVSATLLVRSPTVIAQSPETISINKAADVTLSCDVTSDPAEVANLKVEWLKDGIPIDYARETHVSMSAQDYSLTLRHCAVRDSAEYRCTATNGLDSARSNPTALKVKDRPQAPYDVRVLGCTSQTARLAFRPGSANNDPISFFTVYYTIGDSGQYTEGAMISADDLSWSADSQVQATVEVRPWRTYAFFVTASNDLGVSEWSARSAGACITPQTAPERNPAHVCSKIKGPRQLVITWEAVPHEEHLGEGFHYVVSYRQLSSHDPPMTQVIHNPNQTELEIYQQPTFTKYEISVWSANDVGATPPESRERRIGYSGEGKPQDAPSNFGLNGNRFNGTFGEFEWNPVNTDIDRIRGFFIGYRIKFWKTKKPNDVRFEDIVINNSVIDLCPLHPSDPRAHLERLKRSFGQVVGSTSKLWPFSRITAGVAVLNSAHDGNLSNTIEFETPEGAPGVVADLTVIEIGSSHLVVSWKLPEEEHGAILSYIVEHQVAPPAVGPLHKTIIDDPPGDLLSLRLVDLEDTTVYRVTLSAVTTAGPGETLSIDERTLPPSNPDQPSIHKIDAGVNSANVTFQPAPSPPINPGSHFHVEYIKRSKEGSNIWDRTSLDPFSENDWIYITDLEPGAYLFRVVAANGVEDHIRETRSEPMEIVVGETHAPPGPLQEYTPEPGALESVLARKHIGASWFIILMCIIAFLLLVLLIVCIVNRSRGDIYPVYEKEQMWGRDPFAPEETPFGEYNDSGRPVDRSRSQVSLDSEEKPIESDSDSLAEYEDHNASKFNEDGSFIGQYTGKNRPPPQAPGHPAMSPTAMNTFV